MSSEPRWSEPLRPGAIPGRVVARVPAGARVRSRIRGSLEPVLRDIEGEGADLSGVLMASEVLADVLVDGARPWAMIAVAVDHDDHDLYVRLSAPRPAVAGPLRVEPRSERLLDGVVESVDLTVEGTRALAVVQQPRAG